ncbi:agip17 [Agrotis ipsilon multiple nucleopolyhedrovirus]|uniref:Late expression factor-2 n=1 Tax=Agrotis ipsilon multiple nucleopolyhedrovirus TaxID=208013 RepID=B6D5T1_9ABAC|nr:agip17 [Agrotis ipsilon multiple nucleopolyhedrovirus]ACI28719.1 late expression factor-2 [Agrotis ipsilon multiple nucleopolyhedrovirus]
MSPPPLLSWTPSNTNNLETINKDADYIVSLDDVPLQVTPFTQFVDNGLRVRINGMRLYYLLKNKDSSDEKRRSSGSAKSSSSSSYKNLKNVCFKSASVKSEVAQMLRAKLKLPDCMQRFLADFEVMPRGKRFRKRFIFNTYIANVVTCTKCAKLCLLDAMSLLYEHEDKCVQEFERILFKNATLYKPPNCVNMKNKDRLCFKSGTCRGSNPICNF